MQRRRAALRLPRPHHRQRGRDAAIRGHRDPRDRLPDEPDRLRRAARRGGHRRASGGGVGGGRPGRRDPLPRGHRPGAADHEHPRADPRGGTGPEGDLHHAGRHLRDGRPTQLDRRLLQDLRAPAGASAPLRAEGRRNDRAGGRAALRGDGAGPDGRFRRWNAGDLGRGGRGGRAGTPDCHGSGMAVDRRGAGPHRAARRPRPRRI